MPDGHPRETVQTVLDGFRAVAPPDWTVTYARGAGIADLDWDPDAKLARRPARPAGLPPGGGPTRR